jgi:MerR family transcriptional regulator/heat shock protein HspR
MLNIEVQVCRGFIDSGLVEVTVEGEEEYIPTRELAKLRRIVSLYRDLGVNREGIEIILEMRDRLVALNDELNRLKRQLETKKPGSARGRLKILKKKGLYFEQ